MDIDVSAQVAGAKEYLKRYQHRTIPNVARKSMNRAIKGGRTDATKELRTRITMPANEIRNRIKLTPVAGGSTVLEARLSIPPKRKGREFSNLGSFKVRKAKRSIKGKRRLGAAGISAKVWAEASFKKYRGAFAWERSGANGTAVTVFKRVAGSAKVRPTKRTGGDGNLRRFKRGPKKGQLILRQPVEPVWGASLTREFVRVNRTGKRPVISIVSDKLRDRFIKEFNRLLRVEQ